MFSKIKTGSEKRRSWCKKCMSEYGKERRLKNPEKVKQESIKWRNENPERFKLMKKQCSMRLKQRVIEGYGGKCSCSGCNEDNFYFLTIDHINGGGHKHRKLLGNKQGPAFYKWLIENNFSSDFRLLCWNCNCGRRYLPDCPHNLGKPVFNL